MTAPAPPPAAPPPEPPSRPAQAALALLVAGAAILLLARGSTGDAARPTDVQPAAVARQVDLNAADKPELLQVPGVGPHLADAILAHRRDRGRFQSVDDLDAVRGVGGKTLDKIRPWVTVAESPAADPAPPPAVETLERKFVAKAPAPPPPSVPTPRGKLQPGDPPLDVNAAAEADLQRLPKIGPALARRIVEARGTERFKSVDDLRRVKGIGAKTLDGLRQYVVCR